MKDTSFKATGSAYYRPDGSTDDALVRVGRGTPCGEMLRRYWHPIYVAEQVKDLPVAIKALGEELVLFRKPNGQYGLVHNRCVHRGTTLLYGKVTEQGIRCCYHGWTFDVDGKCMAQPCESNNGGKARNAVRQPWYPVQERYGLVFAYLGPPEFEPPLPRFDVLETIPEGWIMVSGDSSEHPEGRLPCNWLQHHENTLDGAHVQIVHADQFPPQFSSADLDGDFEQHDWTIRANGRITFGDALMKMTVELIFPLCRQIPDETLMTFYPDGGENGGLCNRVWWTLPLDDYSIEMFTARVEPIGTPPQNFAFHNGETWDKLDFEGHQRFPGDYECQIGQGAITLHSDEHLVKSDEGIVMYRRMLRKAIEAVQNGGDPPMTRQQEAINFTTVAGVHFVPIPERSAVVESTD